MVVNRRSSFQIHSTKGARRHEQISKEKAFRAVHTVRCDDVRACKHPDPDRWRFFAEIGDINDFVLLGTPRKRDSFAVWGESVAQWVSFIFVQDSARLHIED